MLHHTLKILLLLNAAVSVVHCHLEEFEACTRSHDKSPGICTKPRSCVKAKEENDRGIRPTFCENLNGTLLICCPQETGNHKRISVQKCEEYEDMTKTKSKVITLDLWSPITTLSVSTCERTTALIVGGEKTMNGEFPHMAAIGWRSDLGYAYFHCGGSLISERFVLTAAHCNTFIRGKLPLFVRLGDQNLRGNEDGMDHMNIDIADFIVHEKYRSSSYYFDIAVIRLSETVEFKKHIRPACLWQHPIVDDLKVTATGWGYTSEYGFTSDDLMKVNLDVIDGYKCNKFLKGLRRLSNGILKSQICAGVLSGGKDTCNGDSGGPIQIRNGNSSSCLYHVVGVTSFGSTRCGSKNTSGVYSRVSYYLDWIEKKVWN